MGLNIPEEVLQSAKISAEDLLTELAVYLYDSERLSFGQAKNLAGYDHLSFQQELAKRDIYIKYDEDDLEEDLKNLEIFNKEKQEEES